MGGMSLLKKKKKNKASNAEQPSKMTAKSRFSLRRKSSKSNDAIADIREPEDPPRPPEISSSTLSTEEETVKSTLVDDLRLLPATDSPGCMEMMILGVIEEGGEETSFDDFVVKRAMEGVRIRDVGTPYDERRASLDQISPLTAATPETPADRDAHRETCRDSPMLMHSATMDNISIALDTPKRNNVSPRRDILSPIEVAESPTEIEPLETITPNKVEDYDEDAIDISAMKADAEIEMEFPAISADEFDQAAASEPEAPAAEENETIADAVTSPVVEEQSSISDAVTSPVVEEKTTTVVTPDPVASDQQQTPPSSHTPFDEISTKEKTTEDIPKEKPPIPDQKSDSAPIEVTPEPVPLIAEPPTPQLTVTKRLIDAFNCTTDRCAPFDCNARKCDDDDVVDGPASPVEVKFPSPKQTKWRQSLDSVPEFANELIFFGFPLIHHRPSGDPRQDTEEIWVGRSVNMVLRPGEVTNSKTVHPRLEWSTDAGGRSKKSQVDSIGLRNIHSIVLKPSGSAGEQTQDDYHIVPEDGGDAMCFFTITSDSGDVHVFESVTERESERLVSGILATSAVISEQIIRGDPAVLEQCYALEKRDSFGCFDDDAPELSVDEAMSRLSFAYFE